MKHVRSVTYPEVVIYSVKLILYPGTPVHRWQHAPISHILFKRHFMHLFSQSNDKLGAFILDALWRANHGQMEALRHEMLDPDDADMPLSLGLSTVAILLYVCAFYIAWMFADSLSGAWCLFRHGSISASH